MSLLKEQIPSFRFAGEDLTLLTGAQLQKAAKEYNQKLLELPASHRDRFEEEQAGFVARAHEFVVRYNKSLHRRVRGYLELGRRCEFAYQWPVVAVLGICQVLSGFSKARLYGIAGQAAGRMGFELLDKLSDSTDDILRRTNRGIFHDSVPTVLYGLHAHELRSAGSEELASSFLQGPLPLLLDEECRAIAKDLYEALDPSVETKRFDLLYDLTRRHFRREQSIFSHHLGPKSDREESFFTKRFARVSSVPAPVVRRQKKLVFEPYRLPAGFDIRDHKARVEHFTKAFIEQSVSTLDDYKVAVAYVVERFGRSGERSTIAY